MKIARAKLHFCLFRLEKLFTAEVATDLVNIKDRLISLHGERGVDAIRQHLDEEAESRELRL